MSPRGRFSAVVMLSGLLVACSSGTSGTNSRSSSAATTSAPSTAAPTTNAAATAAAFKVNHCSMLTPAEAAKIVGTQNSQLAMPPLHPPGGKLLDFCDYVHTDVATASGTAAGYGVVVYPNATTAKAMVAKAVAQSLTLSAPPQPFAVPGMGRWSIHSGVSTWPLQAGVNASLAIVGTSVGPYLVWAEGGATASPGAAEQYAVTVAKSVFPGVPG